MKLEILLENPKRTQGKRGFIKVADDFNKEKGKMFSFRLSRAQTKILEHYLAHLKEPKSDIFRKAIYAYLKSFERDVPPLADQTNDENSNQLRIPD